MLLKLLNAKYGTVPEALQARVQGANVDELDVWVDRALVAETLDAVFAS